MSQKHKKLLLATVASALLVIALTSLSHLLSEISFAEVKQAIHDISAAQLLLAAVFTAASYLSMSLYDYQALKVIGKPQRWQTAATATTISYSLSNTLGFAALTGAAARFRVYRSKGLAPSDVARVMALAMGSFWAAVIFSSGLALIKQTQGLTLGPVSLTNTLCLIIGSAMLGLIAVLLGLIVKNHGSVTLYRLRFDLPNYKQALGLIAGACLDIGFCSAALFVLMPEGSLPSFAVFFALFSLAIALSLLSLIPGGVGVFETLMLLSVDAPKAQVLASLLGFRVIYYLMPFVIASVWLGIREGLALRASALNRASSKPIAATHMTRGFAPLVISSLVFLSGLVLLVSGSLPTDMASPVNLEGVLPSSLISLSHLGSYLSGTALLILAHGLQRRLFTAYRVSALLLIFGAGFSVLKGADIVQALVCLSVVALLYWTKGAFDRRSPLIGLTVTPLWLLMVSMTLICCVWLGLFTHQYALGSQTQWWTEALGSEAPKFLRASIAAAVMIAAAAVLRFFSRES